eukprot:GHVU01020228.1.p1 GENE.GHVU01020228.1~~GHVU01020228.1.p1  ORF type:complete len:619 (-),score=56.87 GHVU01020228.1:266-1876(-)
MAIKCGYPEKSLYKLYLRRGKSMKQLGSVADGKFSLEKAVESLQVSELNDKRKVAVQEEIDKLIVVCSTEKILQDKQNLQKDEKLDERSPSTRAPILEAANETYPSLAANCQVSYTPEAGRFIQACQDINPGDIILVEAPYASVVLPDQLDSHCHNCFKFTSVQIPCTHCALARYCSEKCRQSADTIYHNYECKILSTLYSSGLGKFSLIAVRCMTKSQSALEQRKQLCGNDQLENAGLSEDGRYYWNDYKTICRLVTHDTDRQAADLFRRCCNAVFLVHCLEKAGYFQDYSPKSEDLSLQEVKNFVGGLILSHLQAFPCNAHEISELELKQSVTESVTSELGGGIYATLSLFNHSCDPTVTRNFYGDVCVVRATRSIFKGEEVSDNYGAIYAVMSREERQEKMKKQYFFTCGCEACTKDWPFFLSPELEKPKWRCSSCGDQMQVLGANKFLCPSCQSQSTYTAKNEVLRKSGSKFQRAFQTLLSKGEVAETLPVFLKYAAVISKHVCRPWKDFNSVTEAIKQCYNIHANCYKLPQ